MHNSPQNISILNLIPHEKIQSPPLSRIYVRDAKMVQHIKINSHDTPY